ncbi:MAG: sn-glycerol-3-phosphate ABC transporter ATP-binding protein UgpC [Rhizobiaceae bacterium]|nr:sn-glycerol-3-phosphate ABC transporter ATP-binding protein UgpC [Rhizobiaceae bacterium]
MSTLQLENVRKSFGKAEVIHGVDLEVDDGEFVVFVGPSGCGKSTMLRMIAGLETVSSGQLKIDGRVVNEMTPGKRGIAMVFQSYSLYPNMTVRQNMEFGLQQAKTPKPEIKRLVDEAATILKLHPVIDKRPGQLSGGQSQRVAIGRAIVRDPGIFLFDEPLSNLDAELRVHMRVELKSLHQRLGRTMIYVTHDQVEAMTMADRIVVFNDGVIEQVGTPLELYNAPANLFVAGFIGSPKINLLDAKRETGDTLQVPGGKLTFSQLDRLSEAGELVVGIRPEHVVVADAGDADISGKVTLAEQLGGETFLYVEIDGLENAMIARAPGQIRVQSGETVGLRLPSDRLYLFDPKSGRCLNRLTFD